MLTDNNLAETGKQFGLQDGYNTWAQDMKNYTQAKKEFQGVPEPYKKVTTEFIKKQDVVYNPITQTYTDSSKEQAVRQMEKQNMVEVLAKNKVSTHEGSP